MMDAVEEWLRSKASDPAPDDDPDADPSMVSLARNILTQLADEWAAHPPVALLPYQGDRGPLDDFLDKVEGPAMIGLDPVIYPACVRCNAPWMMRRSRGVWAWFPDCPHKSATCKLVKA